MMLAVEDQLLHVAARAQAGLGQHLVQLGRVGIRGAARAGRREGDVRVGVKRPRHHVRTAASPRRLERRCAPWRAAAAAPRSVGTWCITSGDILHGAGLGQRLWSGPHQRARPRSSGGGGLVGSLACVRAGKSPSFSRPEASESPPSGTVKARPRQSASAGSGVSAASAVPADSADSNGEFAHSGCSLTSTKSSAERRPARQAPVLPVAAGHPPARPCRIRSARASRPAWRRCCP